MKKAHFILLVPRALVLLSIFGLLLALAAPAMANQPAYRYTEDVTGDVLVCQGRLYTITSGELWTVIHEGESASGNTNYTITVTPHQVVAVDGEGHEFSIVGAAWFGATLNANTGGFQGTDILKLQVVGQGSGAGNDD
jgi:type II secretory pathway pseudopilin PulG